jgi:Glycosyltransferase sugar-binding region containing DXD motif
VSETKEVERHVVARLPSDMVQKIPRTILQTFGSRRVPRGLFEATRSWLELNPEYEYKFYDDDDCRTLIREHFGEQTLACYELLTTGAFRADFWRYCALFVHGGVYADADTLCTRPLRELIGKNDDFIVPRANDPRFLFNAFICSVPRHPFLKNVIDRAVERITAGDSLDPFFVVGPGALGIAVNKTLGREVSSIFRVGSHNTADFSFRILRKIVTPWMSGRRVLDGFRTIFMCHYKGYFNDLKRAGLRHWSKDTPLPTRLWQRSTRSITAKALGRAESPRVCCKD